MAMGRTLLVLSFVLGLLTFIDAECGLRPHTRIVGGTEAQKNSWPWQAMLRFKGGDQFCGGTLIDPLWVVTAAHCVEELPANRIVIRMGAHYRESDSIGTEQDIDVKEVIAHEEYHSPLAYSNDIALLKLTEAVRTERGVGVACLPDSNVPLPLDDPGKKCWITGWGTLSSGGIQPNELMQASVPLVSKQRCLEGYPGKIHDSMLCAGLDQGGVDACQGDSGGPLVCEYNGQWHLEGATSWGYGCAAPRQYGVYAKVRHFKSWISSKMSGSPPPKPTSSGCADDPSFEKLCPELASTKFYCSDWPEWTKKYCAKSCHWCD